MFSRCSCIVYLIDQAKDAKDRKKSQVCSCVSVRKSNQIEYGLMTWLCWLMLVDDLPCKLMQFFCNVHFYPQWSRRLRANANMLFWTHRKFSDWKAGFQSDLSCICSPILSKCMPDLANIVLEALAQNSSFHYNKGTAVCQQKLQNMCWGNSDLSGIK